MQTTDKFMGLETAIVDVESLEGNPENYNQHPLSQVERLAASLEEFGQTKPILVRKLDDYHSRIIAGHGLKLGKLLLQKKHPGVAGHHIMWVAYAPDDWSDAKALAYLVADNELQRGAVKDVEKLAFLIDSSLAFGFSLAPLGFDASSFQQLKMDMTIPDDVARPDKSARPNKRLLPFDMIYTLQGADCTCCLAVQAGLRYGIPSNRFRLCPYTYELTGRHEVTFIDCDYFNYKHDVHLAVVQRFRPKYATVKDVMTMAQCQESNMDYTPLEQILDWAHELAEHAQNVILIPKYDCIDKLPEQFMLGYSVPSSHGATPLPIEAFRGRRVHLLGGSWASQLSYMAALGDDIVSADNNHVAYIAGAFGQFVRSGGETLNLSDAGLGSLNNPRYASLALSFGSIGAKLQELYAKEEVNE